MKKIRLALFASGSGTNAENIIKYFQNHQKIEVASVFSNNPDAYVITRAQHYYVPVFTFTKADMNNSNRLLDMLHDQQIDVIVLAGFLWLIPNHIIEDFNNRIINIHPALLPNYGGKGMYGDRVHKCVWENAESETGITIHKVNEHYDQGQVLFQATIELQRSDTPDIIASKVHELEYKYYPGVIEQFVLGNVYKT